MKKYKIQTNTKP